MRGIRGIEPGLEIGEDRVECGAERDEKTVGAFAVSFPDDVTFPKARNDAPQVSTVAAYVTTLPEILRPGGGVAVEALQHVGDVAVDIVD